MRMRACVRVLCMRLCLHYCQQCLAAQNSAAHDSGMRGLLVGVRAPRRCLPAHVYAVLFAEAQTVVCGPVLSSPLSTAGSLCPSATTSCSVKLPLVCLLYAPGLSTLALLWDLDTELVRCETALMLF